MNEQKNKILVALICVFFISLGLTLAVGFSNQQEPSMLIKSVTPIYDEDSTVVVNDDGVVFNDKDQVVKYNVVVENPNNYDVKVSDIVLSTPTEDFLEYEVENLEIDDVIGSNSVKELVVSFETVKKDGWGRNFEDELIANISFAKVVKKEEQKPTPEPEEEKKEDKKEEQKVDEVPSQKEETKEEVTVPNDDPVNNIENDTNDEEIKEESNEKDPVEDNKEETTDKEKVNRKGNNVLIIVLGSITVVSGLIIIIIVVKDKKKKTAALIFILLTGVTLVNAKELIELPLTFKISFESQNVMKPSGWKVDEQGSPIEFGGDYWAFPTQITDIIVENDIVSIENVSHEFDVSNEQNGRVKAYLVQNEKQGCADLEGNEDNCYDLHLQADGIIYSNPDASFYFTFMTLENIINLEGFDTSNVTDMSYMFAYATSARDSIDLDLSSFNTSNVTNMSYMFSEFGLYTNSVRINLKGFDTRNVTDMSYMFEDVSSESKSLVIDVSTFDTSNVTNMRNMFAYTGNYSEELILDLRHFNTSKVTDMSGMFKFFGANSKNVILDVSSFDTSNVTNMSYMFSNVAQLYDKDFNIDISNFNTSKVTNMDRMLYGVGESSTELVLDLSNFDFSKVESMNYMLANAGKSSLKFNTSMTISNYKSFNRNEADSIFSNVATNPGTQLVVNYTSKTSKIVDDILSSVSSSSNVIKGELVKIEYDDMAAGDYILIGDEAFNVVSHDAQNVTLFAKYNIGIDYKQSMTPNVVPFSNVGNWEYSPGPKEIPEEFWTEEIKGYLNGYKKYMNDKINGELLSVNLITVAQLRSLGCSLNDDYSASFAMSCASNNNSYWIVNGQDSWTRSASSSYENYVIYNGANGLLTWIKYEGNEFGVRPVITIAKDDLKKLYK